MLTETQYIRGPLKEKIGLSDLKRPKTYMTIENFMYMERQLWQNDGHEYLHDGYRVLISAKLKCHVFTSARVGEISEGSSRAGTGKGLLYRVREYHNHATKIQANIYEPYSTPRC